MKFILLVGMGGFIGSAGRYLIYLAAQQRNLGSFPLATLLVNLAGCFLIGLLFGWAEKAQWAEGWRFFLFTGILGGFTTFSAFGLETQLLVRAGQTATALFYVLASVLGGLGLTFLGAWLRQ